jgi:hypothetical protein
MVRVVPTDPEACLVKLEKFGFAGGGVCLRVPAWAQEVVARVMSSQEE